MVVTVARRRPVSLLATLIAAAGIGAPDSSVTAPAMVPVGACARPATASPRRRTNHKLSRRGVMAPPEICSNYPSGALYVKWVPARVYDLYWRPMLQAPAQSRDRQGVDPSSPRHLGPLPHGRGSVLRRSLLVLVVAVALPVRAEPVEAR